MREPQLRKRLHQIGLRTIIRLMMWEGPAYQGQCYHVMASCNLRMDRKNQEFKAREEMFLKCVWSTQVALGQAFWSLAWRPKPEVLSMEGSCKKWLSFSVCEGEAPHFWGAEAEAVVWKKELQEGVHPVSEMRKEKERATPLTKIY